MPATLLFAVVAAFLLALPLPASAQSSADEIVFRDPTQPAPPQPFLDRKVDSSLEGFNRWKARMKGEHLTAYLSTYSGVLASVTGFFFGLLAYRMSDPMSPYRLIKRRTLQLAMAIGGSLGILAAVTQVPPSAPGRISLLIAATLAGATSAFLFSCLAFQIMRSRSNRAALKDGRRLGERMRQA